MTWRAIMAYAHQGIELKPIPGVAPGPMPPAPQVAAAEGNGAGTDASPRPAALTRRASDVLIRMERLFDDAARASRASVEPAPAPAPAAGPAAGPVNLGAAAAPAARTVVAR
jgi:penicillin-binding protein 1A